MPPRERSRDTRLLRAGYAESTQIKYLSQVSAFVTRCLEEKEHIDNMEELDLALMDYFHYLYFEEGAGKQKAVDCFYGLVMLMPRFRSKECLPGARAALRGYQKLCPSESWPPLTRPLMALIAVELHRMGRKDMALAVLMSFAALLRIGEVVGLKKEDVAARRDARLGVSLPGCGLRLRKTKTGTDLWATIDDDLVCELLRKHVATRPRGSSLFSFSAASLRREFNRATSSLGLVAGYVFHSLRHGRATELSLLGHPLEDILRLGRWTSTKAARKYIQSGRALLLSTTVSPELAARAQVVLSLLPFFFA